MTNVAVPYLKIIIISQTLKLVFTKREVESFKDPSGD